MSTATPSRLHEVELGTASLERFRTVLSDEQWERLQRAAARAHSDFEGRVIWNVNSTARGGGVAELLGSLVPYSRGAGVDVRWVVIEGDPDFFRVTKRIHNMLHGMPGDGEGLSQADAATYQAVSKRNALELVAVLRPGDLVLLHDPQTAGLVEPLRRHGVRVVWRCHVGTDTPNDLALRAWSFLRPYVEDADRLVFSRAAFIWEGLERTRVSVIPPSIDAFTPKNQPLPPGRSSPYCAQPASTGSARPAPPPSPALTAAQGASAARSNATARRRCPAACPRSSRCRAGTGSKTPPASCRRSPTG